MTADSDKTTFPRDLEADQVSALMDGFRASQAVFSAVELGVFDALESTPSAPEPLAELLNCDASGMARLLGACASVGVLEVADGVYSNSPAASRFLCRDSPETFAGYILYSQRAGFRLWSHLADAVREGSNRWAQEYGGEKPLFDHFFGTDADKRTFLAGMHGQGLSSSPAIAQAFDFSPFRHLVDLGGGTGHFPIAMCGRYPELRATVFDLPKVVPVSAEYAGEAGLAERIGTQAGDLFSDAFPAGDLYHYGRILHDWGEEKVAYLVAKAYEHLPENGALLVSERLLDEDGSGPASAYLQSLNMLVCTEGRERKASEYEALLRGAGFRSVAWKRTGRLLDVVMAVK